MRGSARRKCATARAFSTCRSMRTASVSIPCNNKNALIGASTAPVVRWYINGARAGDECLGAETVDVDEPVIGLVGLAEHRKARRIRPPIEAAGIDNRSAHCGAMPAHTLPVASPGG